MTRTNCLGFLVLSAIQFAAQSGRAVETTGEQFDFRRDIEPIFAQSRGGTTSSSPTDHWSLQPLRPVRPPSINDPWIANAMVQLVLERVLKIEIVGLQGQFGVVLMLVFSKN